MKVFRNKKTAERSNAEKETFFLNSTCPYQAADVLCGNWCSLFYFQEEKRTKNKNTSAHVILGCKAGEKLLYVNELVED